MWESQLFYYSIQIQMGLSGTPALFITCQRNQGMDQAEEGGGGGRGVGVGGAS